MNFPFKRVTLGFFAAGFLTCATALAQTPAAPTPTAPVPNDPNAPQNLIITANPEGQEGPTRAKAEKSSVPEATLIRRFSTQGPQKHP